MSSCNFTQLISPNTCIGDSLVTINANFSALDENLCSMPDVIPGLGIVTNSEISEQNHSAVRISTKNSFVFGSTFNYTANTISNSILLSDSTSLAVTTFANTEESPLATFSTVSLTDSIPKVSLFWTASGSNVSTIYATNSSSASNNGPITFNGSVVSLLSSDNNLYVGGEFTSVGESLSTRKICAINVDGGNVHPTLEAIGSLVTNSPLTAFGDLGSYGAVNAIAEYEDLLIIGGSYKGEYSGRGLTITNKQTGSLYPFYVNGTVNKLAIVNGYLYAAGEFDYINYSPQSSETYKIPTNSIIKINLSLVLDGNPNNSIDISFAENLQKLFVGPAIINSVIGKGSTIYVGGIFDIKSGSFLTSRNLAAITNEGTQVTTWEPIINGPVYTLAVDGSYLYVGGSFSTFYTKSQFYNTPRLNDDSQLCTNAICFNCDLPRTPVFQSVWKPFFNGAVTQFAFHDSNIDSYVYCYGHFTKANSTDVRFIAAIDKSFNNQKGGSTVDWKVNIQKAPLLVNQGLSKYSNSLIIGGNFLTVESDNRKYLARVQDFNITNSTNSLFSVVWDFGSQACTPGASLSMNLTNYSSVTAFPGTYGTVNETVFSVNEAEFARISEGTLLRFFVRRPKQIGTLTSPAHVLGWKVNFN